MHIMLNNLCNVYKHLAFYTTFKLYWHANAAVQHTPIGPMLTLNLDLCHAHVRLCCVVYAVRRFLCAHAHKADIYTNVCTLVFRYRRFLNHSPSALA